jgi:hypothetical protein
LYSIQRLRCPYTCDENEVLLKVWMNCSKGKLYLGEFRSSSFVLSIFSRCLYVHRLLSATYTVRTQLLQYIAPLCLST